MTGRSRFDWLVVGSQFAATIGAYLASQDGAHVAMVDSKRSVCSSMRGKRWGGFQLDFGCQMFSSYGTGVDDPVFEILDGDVVWLDRHLASVTAGRKSEGYEFPDLTAYGPEMCGQILGELVEAAAHEADTPHSMADAVQQRYGATAARLISEIVETTFGLDTDDLAPDAYHMLPFARLVLLSDAAARILKKVEVLDERIAARNIVSSRTAAQGPVYYPAKGGMAAFCDHAGQKLHDRNVTMLLGRDIIQIEAGASATRLTLGDGTVLEADRLLWASDPDRLAEMLGFPAEIADQIQPIPLVAFYFDIGDAQAGTYTYLQSYDGNDLLFRGSVPGSYGTGTCPPGRTYACGEVITETESDIWQNPSAYAVKVWQEMQDHGIVTGPEPCDTHIISAPVSYSFPKTGYASAFARLQNHLDDHPHIRLVGRSRNGRHETVSTVRQIVMQNG